MTATGTDTILIATLCLDAYTSKVRYTLVRFWLAHQVLFLKEYWHNAVRRGTRLVAAAAADHPACQHLS